MNRHNMRLRHNGCFNKTKALIPSDTVDRDFNQVIGKMELWRESGIQRSYTPFFYNRKSLKKGYFNGCSTAIGGYARFQFGIKNRV